MVNDDVHEDIERRGDRVGCDCIRGEAVHEILEAAWVVLVVVVKDFERLRAAWSEEKVVAARGVVDDDEHGTAAVGVERVAGGRIDRVGVVNGAPRRQPLARVRACERHQIRHLFALRIDDAQDLTLVEREAHTGLRGNVVARDGSVLGNRLLYSCATSGSSAYHHSI